MRVLEARLKTDDHSISLALHVMEQSHSIPSVLGRDFMSDFTLVMRDGLGVVLLLDDDEADGLDLPI